MEKWIQKIFLPSFPNLKKGGEVQGHIEVAENFILLQISSIWNDSDPQFLYVFEFQCRGTIRKKKKLNYGRRSKHGNSIQSSHAIKCLGGSKSQKKCSGLKESFLLALLLRDSSNIRVVTSNTTEVSQGKFLLCHGQHIKIKKFLKLSTAQILHVCLPDTLNF